MTEWLHFHFSLSCIEGNGNPLQCSCLENPRDVGAWWAAISGVAQSRTRLKWLSSSRRHMLQYCSPFNIPERKTYSFSPSTLPVTFTTVFLLSPKPCFVLLWEDRALPHVTSLSHPIPLSVFACSLPSCPVRMLPYYISSFPQFPLFPRITKFARALKVILGWLVR